MPQPYPLATLGYAVQAGHPITVWCNYRGCSYRQEHGQQYRNTLTVADLAAVAERYGADLPFIEFRKRLRCRHCGSGDVSTVVEQPYVTPAERWAREQLPTSRF